MKPENIPAALRDLPQWCLWKIAAPAAGQRETKLPFHDMGGMASVSDPETWGPFDRILSRFNPGKYDGLGFVFTESDPFVGIDLDGCRDPETGLVEPWAKEIIEAFATYAEVSPSKTGVKLWCLGKSPFATGKKKTLADMPKLGDKFPAIEIYDKGRWFAVTGLRLRGATEPQPRQAQLDWLKEAYWPAPYTPPTAEFRSHDAVVERARRYVAKLPPAISEQGGHNAAFHAACVLVLGFGLPKDTALALMREYNATCKPEWSERELIHKVTSADQQPGPRNYLRDVRQEKWDTVTLPTYGPLPPRVGPRIEKLDEAAQRYADKIRDNGENLVSLGIGKLDAALGGGVEPGEMVLMCARPSHGKSMAALQCVHGWTATGIPSMFASEEMSALALGKRSLQFISSVPQEHWATSMTDVMDDLEHYRSNHAPTYIVEQSGDVDVVCEHIESMAKENGVKCVIVDYAQLLKAPGKERMQQVAYTSMALKSVANKTGVVLVVLCQMSRAIESRKKFIPVMSDIGESGQLERDADVILFLVWPHQLNKKNPPDEYQIWVSKNRNRPIREGMVECKFFPSRQMLLEPTARDKPNYNTEIDAFNNRKDFN